MYYFKNKYPFIVLLLFLFLSSFLSSQNKSGVIQTIEGKKFYIHKVEKKQSLYAITKIYNVSLEELYQFNPDLRKGAQAGQDIKVPFISSSPVSVPGPSANPEQPDTSKFICHKVSKSETMYSLTRKFNLTDRQLLAYNPSLAQGIKEGQLIIVGEKTKRKPTLKEQKDSRPVFTARESRPAPVVMDSSLFKPVSKPKKPTYNVGLILPFRLDQTLNLDLNELAKNKSNFPAVPSLALDFYTGFKRAADSLSGKDFSITCELYDVDDKDSIKLHRIVSDPKFKMHDLIFGPVYASGFKAVGSKAREHRIPVVLPVTQQNKVLYNSIYISKTNPSQFTLLEGLADYIMDSLLKDDGHVILMIAFEKDKKEMAFVNAFKKYYDERMVKTLRPLKDSVSVARGIEGLKTAIFPLAKNIVVMLSNNQVFIADFTTQLAMFAEKKEIVLCGWQSVSEMDNIDQEYLNQFNFIFPSQFNLSGTAAYRSLIEWYKARQASSPGEYFFIGFDIAWYYLKNLKEAGPDFLHQLDTMPMETNYMRFKFARPDNSTGFDNRGVYIFKYGNYQLQRTGWK